MSDLSARGEHAAALRVLLTEGSSTSARETVTALGLAGHHVEICDPDWRCLSRFSKFVRRFHRCPGLGSDAEGYLRFMLDLIRRERFDVLLPTHEQGYLLSRFRDEIRQHVAIALPTFENYERALNKAAFSRVLTELELPQPNTVLGETLASVRRRDDYPFVLKTAIGTASRGVWVVTNEGEREAAMRNISHAARYHDELLIQQFVPGALEHAQAVFANGSLMALHGYRQIVRGAGGGEANKESILRPIIRDHMTRLGRFLEWHGGLSVDYLIADGADAPLYIDCNPRLVEPMSAYLAGNDLVDLLLRVSRGPEIVGASQSREGVRTHLKLQAMLGCALRGGTRKDLVRELVRIATRRGLYQNSEEELTPVRRDWMSAIPVLAAACMLLVRPSAASSMAAKGWGEHLLTRESMQAIRQMKAAL